MNTATQTNGRVAFIAENLGVDLAAAEIITRETSRILDSWGCESQVLEIADLVRKIVKTEAAR